MSTEPAGPLAPAYRLLTVTLVAMVTVVAFESMAVSTAMPTVAAELHAVRSFGLAFSFMLSASLLGTVLAGLWCDRSGPVAPLLVGQAGFALGGLVCGAATNLATLLAGRVITGVGGGLLVVALYVAIGRAYPMSLRPKVFGWISAAWVLPSIVGPLIAGFLTEHASWRWVFWCVVPIAALTSALSWSRRHSFEGAEPSPGSRADQTRVALLGAVLAIAAGVLQWGSQDLRPLVLGPALAALVALVVVAAVAPRLVPPGTARLGRGLPSVMAARFLLTACFNGAIPFVALMLVAERSMTNTQAGIVLMLGSIGWSAGSAMQAREHALDKHRLLSIGGACVSVGALLLAAVPLLGLAGWALAVGIVAQGFGMGLAMSTISVLSLDLTPVADHGRTSASLQLSDTLGSALGVALTGALFAALHVGSGHDGPTYALIWVTCAVVGAVVWFAGMRSAPLDG